MAAAPDAGSDKDRLLASLPSPQAASYPAFDDSFDKDYADWLDQTIAGRQQDWDNSKPADTRRATKRDDVLTQIVDAVRAIPARRIVKVASDIAKECCSRGRQALAGDPVKQWQPVKPEDIERWKSKVEDGEVIRFSLSHFFNVANLDEARAAIAFANQWAGAVVDSDTGLFGANGTYEFGTKMGSTGSAHTTFHTTTLDAGLFQQFFDDLLTSRMFNLHWEGVVEHVLHESFHRTDSKFRYFFLGSFRENQLDGNSGSISFSDRQWDPDFITEFLMYLAKRSGYAALGEWKES